MRFLSLCAGLFLLSSGFACSCGTPAVGGDEGEGSAGEGEGAPGEGEGSPGEGEGSGEGEGEGAGDTPPVVVITAPADGSSSPQGASITFIATATDAEDGVVANGSVVWTDDLEPLQPLGTGATITTALTVAGAHTVTCTATDSANVSTSASIVVNVTANGAPVVVITSPADGSFHLPSETIDFTASANDPEDGVLSGASVQWTDNGTSLGAGTTVSTALPLGDHVIDATATDSAGVSTTAEITIHVVTNLPPSCSISNPVPPVSIVAGTTVTFDATCVDPDGAQGANTPISNAAIVWTSDLQSPQQLGVGATVTTALTAVGLQHVTVCATDTVDNTVVGCTEIDVDVQANVPPVVTINSPADGATFNACELPIALSCSAVDQNPGQVSTFVWADNGTQISTNRNVSFVPTTAGVHVLSCTATDPFNASTTATATITVTSPGALITGPANGAVVPTGTVSHFTGVGCSLTAPGGFLPGTDLAWTDGASAIGTGNVVNTTLAAGTHTITLTVNDGSGSTGTDSITVIVDQPPVVTIQAPTNGQTVDSANPVTFTGSATDAEDGVLVPLWVDAQNGALGSGNQVVTSIAPGKHVTTLSATDSVGATTTASVTFFATPGGGAFSTLFTSSQTTAPVQALLFDASTGLVRAGTGIQNAGGGIGVIDYAGDLSASTTIDHNTPGSIPNDTVNDVAVDAFGRVWLATNGGLAAACASDTVDGCTLIDANSGLQSSTTRAVALLPDGRAIVATSNCLGIVDLANNAVDNDCGGDGQGDGLRSDTIFDVAFDPAIGTNGSVWVVTSGGVSLMTPSATGVNADQQTFFDVDGIGNARRVSVAPTSGDAWFATGNGAVRHQGGRNGSSTRIRTNDGLPSDEVRDIAFDLLPVGASVDEVAWIATANGLGRVDTAVSSVIAITTADGLPTANLLAVTVEANHDKVLGTATGVILYVGQ